jgi:hypothetical protein
VTFSSRFAIRLREMRGMDRSIAELSIHMDSEKVETVGLSEIGIIRPRADRPIESDIQVARPFGYDPRSKFLPCPLRILGT